MGRESVEAFRRNGQNSTGKQERRGKTGQRTTNDMPETKS